MAMFVAWPGALAESPEDWSGVLTQAHREFMDKADKEIKAEEMVFILSGLSSSTNRFGFRMFQSLGTARENQEISSPHHLRWRS